ncbi:hypothetical protein CR103_21135 [Massilia psychrophila]|uniref:Uncharacterized protein n=1 Tax=Massilia psychrophila TaxID=1603353 RepID=A0A2G8SWK6_9BURK|nr:hypothetical protein CR103_21135 [Massilia psychrophila]
MVAEMPSSADTSHADKAFAAASFAANAHADSYVANRCKANFGRVTTLTPPAGTMSKGRAIALASASQSARIALDSLFRGDIAAMLYDLGPMALGQLKVHRIAQEPIEQNGLDRARKIFHWNFDRAGQASVLMSLGEGIP